MQTRKTPKQTLERKRCENCNDLFTPRDKEQRFCPEIAGKHCRKEFHRYGSSYGPLKTGLHKAIDKKYAELQKMMVGQMRLLKLEYKCAASGSEVAVEFEKLRAQLGQVRGRLEILETGLDAPVPKR